MLFPSRKVDFEDVRNNTDNLCLADDLLLCECFSIEDMDVWITLDGVSVVGVCIDGCIHLEVGCGNHTVNGGTAFILFPEESFRFSETSYDLNVKFIVFKEDFVKWKGDILNNVGFCSEPNNLHLMSLSDVSLRESIATIETIRRRLAGKAQKFQREIIMHYLQILIYDIVASSREEMPMAQDNASNIFEQFLTLVSSHYREHPDVAYYADRLCVSSKHLSRTVLCASGKRASDWIANARIIEAKICLRMTKMSLADISARLGFSSPSHFGRFFRHHTGLTPMDYKCR